MFLGHLSMIEPPSVMQSRLGIVIYRVLVWSTNLVRYLCVEPYYECYTTKVVPISIDIYGNQSTTTKTKEV